MISLLVYGTGNRYGALKKVLNWEQIQIEAFLESEVCNNFFEETPVYTPQEYINKKGKFDFIICASIYEREMREVLSQLQVPERQIVSGKFDVENFIQYPQIYDISKVIALQNQEILLNTKKIVSRNRFIDMSKGMAWMDGLSLTPGGWAASYDYMYVILRVLEYKRPSSILEMGLGQSSKILSRYQKNTNCDYDIVEQDMSWYQFFTKGQLEVTDKVNIHIKPLEQRFYEIYQENVNCYSGFENVVAGKQFDFISIDGPWGSEKISRIDILPHIPQCLMDSFVIMVDDYGRDGERNMIMELEKILEQNQIDYYKVVYGEEKQFCLITSSDNLFLCTLY